MFSPFHAKNCQNIDHKEDTKEWEVFLNTEVEEVQSTLQLVVSWLPVFLENGSKDFVNILHESPLL